MKIEEINNKYFGSERTHRYLIDVFSECVEKLIVVNVLIEVWMQTNGAHKHDNGRVCNQCKLFYQICFSCIDSLFLHLRLLFSRQEINLANAFLTDLKELITDDFTEYYDSQYNHTLSEDEKKSLDQLFELATDNLPKISDLYMKRVEPYQAFAFHQPEDGKYYKVTTAHRKGEGIKYVTHTRKGKFKRDLEAAKVMLDLIADVIHAYIRLSSSWYHAQNIYPQNYVKETIALLGVESVSDDITSEIINNATKHTEKMVHLLECSGGLNSHNGLIFKKIQSVHENKSQVN